MCQFSFHAMSRNVLSAIVHRNQRVDGVIFVLVYNFEMESFMEIFRLLLLFSEASFAQLVSLAFESSVNLFDFKGKYWITFGN